MTETAAANTKPGRPASTAAASPARVTSGRQRRPGQRSTAELVDQYDVTSPTVRAVFIRYLDERRPGMDYSSLRVLTAYLVGSFWADIERHHPGIDSLALPTDVIDAWKQRMLTVTTAVGITRPRRSRLTVFMKVRAFYLDIAEWALEDPSWARWALPSPIRRGETLGFSRTRKQVTAEMHQRVRERLPHLPTLTEAAERHRAATTDLLHAAASTRPGATVTHAGTAYRRLPDSSGRKRPDGKHVVVEELATGQRTDLLRSEDDAFWAWAIIETLRHTGVRSEELLEITHLALVSYRLPDTGEVVPLLQIVPSKNDEERLLLVSPDLASVLAAVISRVRADNKGVLPLVARYDPLERVTGPPLPHLFQRRTINTGWKTDVISPSIIIRLLDATLARTGLTDTAGKPLRFTPHDFRRIFATEAVSGGLPVHIVAKLLGHQNLATTQAYTAVFQDDLVRTYRAFIDRRRQARPEAEYRAPTDNEWQQFHEHFELRRLELGTCARPYGSPCKHEHACIRCPMLRIDPQQRPRLVTIIRNLNDRIDEARMHGWLGEVEGLQASLTAARTKLTTLDRPRTTPTTRATNLGIPVIRGTR